MSTSILTKLSTPVLFDGVPTLFKITLNYLASNIANVHSLVGFPEIVGEQLFRLTLDLGLFWNRHGDILDTVKLFSEAYPQNMSTICLKESVLVINEYTSAIQCLMTNATELDLSNCYLGDFNELLVHISECKSLKKLMLSGNNLSDSGIRMMTLQIRMFQKGPLELSVLDLSDNLEISNHAIKWIIIFKKLHLLNLSGTNVSNSEVLKKHNFDLIKEYDKPEITSSTWTEEFISHWKDLCQTRIQKNAENMNSKLSTAGSFYGRKHQHDAVIKLKEFTEIVSHQVYVRRKKSEKSSKITIPNRKRSYSKDESISLELMKSYTTNKKAKVDRKTLFDW